MLDARKKKALRGLAFIAPLFIAIVLFLLYPMMYTIILSFRKIALVNISQSTFVGLENYKRLLTQKNPAFLSEIMRVTGVFVVSSVVLQVGFGLGLALLLHFHWLKGRNILRNLYLLPWVTPGIICGFAWKFMLDQYGILNYLFTLVGLPPQGWLTDLRLVLPSVIIANVWTGTTYSLLIQTAGLQSIPQELYDVALVDGASKFQSLTRITLPLLLPFLFINLVTETGDTFHVFDRIYALTGGGPLHKTELLSIFMFRNAFVYGDLGYGAAIAVFEFFIGILFAVAYLFIFRQEKV
ncbi:MAG: sugar ABC transporter permease [Spirochaetaceae bacterium]|nr:MAG: sugar ABC transporter permease [Spirochaetaceae bacterium]